MNQGYGNIGWEIFVYSSYILVAVSLIFYIFISVNSRKKSLKSMYEEGFFQTSNTENKPKKDSIE
jgi:heme exporter protein D